MSEAVVLGRGQLYRPKATPRAYTADRGPIGLYEDIIQALYENTHLITLYYRPKESILSLAYRLILISLQSMRTL
jgi:hypothetical protein